MADVDSVPRQLTVVNAVRFEETSTLKSMDKGGDPPVPQRAPYPCRRRSLLLVFRCRVSPQHECGEKDHLEVVDW
jgi:hypothetical protein